MTCENNLSSGDITEFKENIAKTKTWLEGDSDTTVTFGTQSVSSPAKLIADARLFKPPIDWEEGLSVTDATQSYTYDDVVYAPRPSELPFTAGASFDGTKWYVIQVKYSNIEMLDSTAELLSGNYTGISHIKTGGYTTKGDGGGAEWVQVDGSGTPSTTGFANGVLYDSAGNKWKINENIIYPEMFGAAADGTTDDTAIFTAINSFTEMKTVVFNAKTYRGNASFTRAVNLVFNNTIMTDYTTNKHILSVRNQTETVYDIDESTLGHGDTQFTITGEGSNFEVGDIGYLWDGSVRSGDSAPVNYELVKIKSVSTDTITIEDLIHSSFSVSTIKFYHIEDKISNVTMSGHIRFEPSISHTFASCYLEGIDNLFIDRVSSKGTTGTALSINKSLNVQVNKVSPRDPSSTASGNGYGVGLYKSKSVVLENIIGFGCRHCFDSDSSYSFKIGYLEDMNDQSLACFLGHTGFVGDVLIEKCNFKTNQYAVGTSATGYVSSGGTAPDADHPLRDIRINNMSVKFDVSVNTATHYAIYLRNNTHNLSVDNLNIFANLDSPVASGGVEGIRATGIFTGFTSITNIDSNTLSRIMFTHGLRNGYVNDKSTVYIRNVSCGEVSEPFRFRGQIGIDIDNINLGDVTGTYIIDLENVSAETAYAAFIGDNIKYTGSDIQIINCDGTSANGRFNGVYRSDGNNITITAGYELSASQIQNRRNQVRLVSPSGSGTTTLGTTALPSPTINGATLYITNAVSGRHDLQFDAGSTIHSTFTVDNETTVKIISYAGKWEAMKTLS
jgi:flagellar hook assembly protein FlgD